MFLSRILAGRLALSQETLASVSRSTTGLPVSPRPLTVWASAMLVGALLAVALPAEAQPIQYNYSGNVVANPFVNAAVAANYRQEYISSAGFVDTAPVPRGWSISTLYPQPLDAGGDPFAGPTLGGAPGFAAQLNAQYSGTYNFLFGGAGLSPGSLVINRYTAFAGDTPLRRSGGNPIQNTYGEDIIVNYTAPLAGNASYDPVGANAHWIQIIYTNLKSGSPVGTVENKVDTGVIPQADPYYDTNAAAAIYNARDANGSYGYFEDEPFRPISGLSSADNTKTYYWTAELRLAKDLGTVTNGKKDIQVYSNGISYGFIVAASPDGSVLILFGGTLPVLYGFIRRRK